MGPIGYVHFGDKSSMNKDAPATKFDTGKPRMDLIPPEALMALGEVFAYGAKKYTDRNWEKGMDWGRLVGATHRHFAAWMAGEDDDPESTLPHLWHVLTNVAMLAAYEVRGSGKDDRTTYCRAEDNGDEKDVLEVKGEIQPPVHDTEDFDDGAEPAWMKDLPERLRSFSRGYRSSRTIIKATPQTYDPGDKL
jgi:hypothetical protein